MEVINMITEEELTKLNSFKNKNPTGLTKTEYMRFKGNFQYFLKNTESINNQFRLLEIINKITEDIRWNINDFSLR